MKVFGIGFHKTGTTSLAQALRSLGYSVTGPNGVNDPNIANNALAIANKLVWEYDAFQDNPWPILYKEMYQQFPDAYFIATFRDPEKWINSLLRHFGSNSTPMRSWIYGVGCPKGNEGIYLERYKRHYLELDKFFKEKQKSILKMNLEKGHGWERLCTYLGVEIPDKPFPHANKASARERRQPHQR